MGFTLLDVLTCSSLFSIRFLMNFACFFAALLDDIFLPLIPGDEIKFIFEDRTRKIRHKILCVYLASSLPH